jgi:hypothetical protein
MRVISFARAAAGVRLSSASRMVSLFEVRHTHKHVDECGRGGGGGSVG